ncbi:Zinc metalloproteinase nas-13 [Diplonema papillatum]|nr:Zinc metalloproteinase nas-13 [Diplonema papillatum]
MVMPHGLLAVMLAGAGLANAKLNTEGPHGPPYVLVGDIQVPVEGTHRQADPLGASPFMGKANLWPGGSLRYAIATDSTNSADPAPYLSNDDARISWAVAHLEEKTCIRMSKCASPATCEEPYIRFRSYASGCNSPMGNTGRVNTINLASRCSRGTVVHEILHSLGVQHEHVRFDRDEYVTVNANNLEPGKTFSKYGASGRDLGAYDYGSIMHYPSTAYSINGKPTIEAPQPIGQDSGLSAGDIATIDFLYNGCSAVFAAPVCMASRDEHKTYEINPYQQFQCQFNVEWTAGENVYVSYSLTTAPASSMTFPQGALLNDSDSRRVVFTPSFLDMDKVYTVAATFTAATDAALSTTCSTTVRVVPGPTYVDVKTGHMSNAKTNGEVSIVLFGSGSDAAGDAVMDSPDTGDITTVVVLSKVAPETVERASISLLSGNDWYAEYLMIGDRIAVFDRWVESDSSVFFADFTKSKRYSVMVKTGTLTSAGTDSNIWLTVVGSLGETRAVLLNPRLSGNAFENGDTDTLDFDGRDVGTISSLKVKSDGAFAGSDWDLDYVEVNSQRACFRRWIEEGTYTQAVLGSCDWKVYSVVVKTGTRSGAGTDSNIWLTVIGDRSETNAVKLNPLLSGDAFENGDTDRLTFSNRDVGNIVSVKVQSDGMYAGSDWDLSYITVNSKTAIFNTWIEEGTYTRTVQ